jgi:hypothetical protein
MLNIDPWPNVQHDMMAHGTTIDQLENIDTNLIIRLNQQATVYSV